MMGFEEERYAEPVHPDSVPPFGWSRVKRSPLRSISKEEVSGEEGD